jgi:ABC-type glycerol-3-phosphate transport system permease component
LNAIRRLPGALLAALLAAGIVYPLYFAVAASLTPENELFSTRGWPNRVVLDHYAALFESGFLWQPLASSLLVALTTTALCVLLGTPCAYAIARLRFRGRSAIVGGVLAISMFPQISIVSPLYLLLRNVGLIDTYPGLVLPYLTFAMPLSVWLLTGNLRELPAFLEEAALIDGAGRLRTLIFVIVPIAMPAIATTAILTFIYAYNEFLFALSFTVGPDHQTLPVAIALLRGRYQIPWGQVMAASALTSLPAAALVLAFQRRIVHSFGPRSGIER